MATLLIDTPTANSGEDSLADKGVVETGGTKKWTQKIPFSRAWRKQRKARKINEKRTATLHQKYQLQSTSQEPTETQTKTSNPQTQQRNVAATTTLVADRTELITSKPQKPLAQYALHDNKGAVGAAKVSPSPDRPYPYQEYVGEERVLAQYGHYDNKGAVGASRVSPSPDRPYPYREYVGGQRVLAQYGHYDNKWAVKHPVY